MAALPRMLLVSSSFKKSFSERGPGRASRHRHDLRDLAGVARGKTLVLVEQNALVRGSNLPISVTCWWPAGWPRRETPKVYWATPISAGSSWAV